MLEVKGAGMFEHVDEYADVNCFSFRYANVCDVMDDCDDDTDNSDGLIDFAILLVFTRMLVSVKWGSNEDDADEEDDNEEEE